MESIRQAISLLIIQKERSAVMVEAGNVNTSIDEIYYLESLDQIDALTSTIRYRMISYLTYKPKTAAQLGRDLEISRPKAHYHLQVLVKLGFVRFVNEALVNGIVEKYYIARARFFSLDHLSEYACEHPQDKRFLEKLSQAKNRFLITILEVSREKIDKEKNNQSAINDFSFDFGCRLTPEQLEEIMESLSEIAYRVRLMNEKNRIQRNFYSLPYFHSTILLMESSDKSILVKEEMDSLSG